MEENKKSSQTAATVSEERENHISCKYCRKLIHVNDNYCGYCGKVNSYVEIKIPDGMQSIEVVKSIKKQLAEYVSKLPLDF